MSEVTSQSLENILASAQMQDTSDSFQGQNMDDAEKEKILKQIHPIFLSHTEHTTPTPETRFDKVLHFMRLCLEAVLKLLDIIVDAIIQIAKTCVWMVAIAGILIITTLMTHTTDGFIDILNNSIFKAFGIDTRIEKVEQKTVSNPEKMPEKNVIPEVQKVLKN